MEMSGNKLLWAFFVIILADACSCSQRILHSWVNPGCKESCDQRNLTIVYLRASGLNDTLHYLWDFVNKPSVLLAITSPTAELYINWDDFILGKQNSVNFTENPKYTFGMIIQKIFEFNDVNDTGLIDKVDNENINVLDPKLFHWERESLSQTDQFVELSMKGNNYSDLATNMTRHGNLKFLLNGFRSLDYSDVRPYMLHTENSTQIDIILDHLQTNVTFSKSRFGIELLLVSENDPSGTMSIDVKKRLSDEYTPGIFEIVDIRTPSYDATDIIKNEGAYLQWRPISFTSLSRIGSDSIRMTNYPVVTVVNHTNAVMHSLLYSYYGPRINNLLVQNVNISLGTKGDSFYKDSNYSTWTFIIGYGIPPDEQFSNIVILVISIGLGFPMLIMLSSGLYMCFRRIRKQDSDMFLNR